MFSVENHIYPIAGAYDVLPGDDSVALTEILDFVGITNADGSTAEDDDITSAEGSDDGLFTVEKKDGIWIATAITAFHTEERLSVTVDGVEYEIVVTDAEYNTTIQDLTTLQVGDILGPGTKINASDSEWVAIELVPNRYGIYAGITYSSYLILLVNSFLC